jgi:acetolactate decarboxylase
MKNQFLFLIILIFVWSFPGCSTTPGDRVMQTSTIDALLAGVYDGSMSCWELLDYGNFGIGTFDRLDGEMIILDGTVYQVKTDGKVYTPETDILTPFATVCAFQPDMTFSITDRANYKGLESIIDNYAPNQNEFIAIKITGSFSRMKVRSVPIQDKPYPPLVMVTEDQTVFKLKDIKGTIVGFRSPQFVKGVNVPGYHCHFISDDLMQAGHILNFEIISGVGEVDSCNEFLLILPVDSDSLNDIDLSGDRSAELDQVEK